MGETEILNPQTKPAKEETGLESYIGCKIILAEPMDEETFSKRFKGKSIDHENSEGYHVVYPDGYDSWSPKNTFDRAYRRIQGSELNLLK